MNNNVKCLAPWVHLNTRPDGRVTPCCIWKSSNDDEFKDLNTNSVCDTLNSKSMTLLRKNIIAGIESEGCSYCYNKELNNPGASMKAWFNSTFDNDRTSQCITNTTNAGEIVPDIQFIDVRFSNICNLKCRMCGHGLSSGWYNETKNKFPSYDIPKFITIDCYDKIDPLLADVTEIYFAGGEPLQMVEHKLILEKLIELGNTNVMIKYNTNLSNLYYKRTYFPDLWSKFSKVYLGVSIDDMTDVGEYIRTGLDWNKFKDNFDIVNKMPNLIVAPSPTIGILNVETYPEFEKFCIKQGWINNASPHTMLNFIERPWEQNIHILPESYKAKLLDIYAAHKKWIAAYNLPKIFTTRLDEVISRLRTGSHDIDAVNDLKSKLNSFDKFTGMNWKVSLPHIDNMFEDLK